MAATSTISSFLMKSTDGTTYTKYVDIKDYPEMFGDPEQIQTTTLTNKKHTYVPGVQDSDGLLNFLANYDATDFATINGDKGSELYFAVWFGENSGGTPDGHDGKFSFKGYPFVKLNGKGVNEVREMTVGIVPTTEVSFAAT